MENIKYIVVILFFLAGSPVFAQASLQDSLIKKDTPSCCTCAPEEKKEEKKINDVVRYAHSFITEDSIKILIKKNLRVVYEPIANGYRDLTLIVGFTVDKNGNIRHPKVDNPKHVAEACRVVELFPKWAPELRKNKFGKWVRYESDHSVEVYFDESLYPY